MSTVDKNVRPGVCGICGTAVVQPEKEEQGWHSGHLFKVRLKANQTKFSELYLAQVRCLSHKEPGDQRRFDKDGNLVEISDWEDGWC